MTEHLDPDLVAGWADGTLDPQARAAAEAHAADCVRCQAVLAAMVRTEPAAMHPDRRWFGSRVRWLVPLATAAAAAALWVALSTDALAPGTGPSVARPARTPSDAVGRRAEATSESTTATSDASKREAAPDESRRRRVDVPVPPPTRSEAPRQAEKSVIGETAALDQVRPKSVPEPQVARVEEQRRDPLAGRGAPPAPPPAAAQTPPLPDLTETVAVQSQSQQVQTQATTTQAPLARQAAFSAGAAVPDIATPDPRVRYRVGAAGRIQRTDDGGRSWSVQRSGVKVNLVAGSAPSAGVCWVVGRSGVVLLTGDGGTTWRRIPFPESTDLESVVATDDRTATITARNGRTFQTIDGGVTWQR